MNRRTLKVFVAGLALLTAFAVPACQAVAAEAVDIDKMIATAKTASDHEAVANYYRQQAAEARAQADVHKKMAETYSMSKPGPHTKTHFHGHCEALIRSYNAQAEEYEALAKEHEDMAAKAGK